MVKKRTRLNFEIDKLTNSIENTLTGEVFDTEVVRFSEEDLQQVKKPIGSSTGIRNLRIEANKFTS